jgi:hypothetical protein
MIAKVTFKVLPRRFDHLMGKDVDDLDWRNVGVNRHNPALRVIAASIIRYGEELAVARPQKGDTPVIGKQSTLGLEFSILQKNDVMGF